MLNNQKTFEDRCKRFGSDRYAATLSIAKQARQLEEKYENKILSSEALTWVVRGEEPKILKILEDIDKKRLSDEVRTMEEYLIYIDDMDVRYAVEDSIEKSLSDKHLIYVYNDVEDLPRKARIRILCNMIWQNIYLLKKEGNYNGRRI